MASREDKTDARNAKRTAGKIRITKAKAFNQASKAGAKAGTNFMNMKATSSGYKLAKTNSATKPSVATKQNAKNKMKAQGAKAMGAPTSGYGKSTKPKK
jgi:hypothetical protein